MQRALGVPVTRSQESGNHFLELPAKNNSAGELNNDL